MYTLHWKSQPYAHYTSHGLMCTLHYFNYCLPGPMCSSTPTPTPLHSTDKPVKSQENFPNHKSQLPIVKFHNHKSQYTLHSKTINNLISHWHKHTHQHQQQHPPTPTDKILRKSQIQKVKKTNQILIKIKLKFQQFSSLITKSDKDKVLKLE